MGRAFIKRMVEATREQQRALTVGLPRFPKTKGQLELRKKHGTPTEFAEACVQAIGEISVRQASQAIDKYLAEWKAA